MLDWIDWLRAVKNEGAHMSMISPISLPCSSSLYLYVFLDCELLKDRIMFIFKTSIVSDTNLVFNQQFLNK